MDICDLKTTKYQSSQRKKLSSPIYMEETEFQIKTNSQVKLQPVSFTGEFYQTFQENDANSSQTSSRNRGKIFIKSCYEPEFLTENKIQTS